MTECEKYVCDWVHNFVNENWEKINLNKCDLKNYTKEHLLMEVKTIPSDAIWFITEVMDWGMDRNYYDDIVVPIDNSLNEEINYHIIKLGDKYIKWEWHRKPDMKYTMAFTEPKTKTITVTYWE